MTAEQFMRTLDRYLEARDLRDRLASNGANLDGPNALYKKSRNDLMWAFQLLSTGRKLTFGNQDV